MARRRTALSRRPAVSLATAAAVATALLFALAAPADAHGYLAVPKSRNKIAYERGEYYCPQCLQGQGGEPGTCGDPAQDWSASDFDMRFYGPQATYKEGDVISLSLTLTANHGGRMSFSVCPQPRDQLTRANLATALACFNDPKNFLTRADGEFAGKRFQYLTQGQSNVTTNWRLPAGVSCDNGCVLRWYWTAYQTCAMPCLDSSIDIPSQCGRKMLQLDSSGAPLAPACTTDCCKDPSPTERFANCADVVILSSGNTAPPPPPPSSSPAPPSPSPSPVPPAPPPPPPSNTDCTTASCFCVGKSDSLYVNPFDPTCSSYIQCWANGTSSAIQQCPAGTRFSMVLKYCDWAANVDCPSAPVASPSPAPPVASPSPSPKPPSPSPSPSPKPPSPSPSPSPKPPSPSPSPSPKPPSPSPSPSPKPPSPSPSPSPKPPSPSPSPAPAPPPTDATAFCAGKADGLYSNPLDSSCNSYYQCWNSGKSGALQKCSTGLVFNPTRAYCDWPYNYACPGGGGSGTTPSPSPAPAPAPPSPTPTPPPPPPASPSPAPPPPPAPSPTPQNPLLPSAKLIVGYYQTWSSPWAGTGANLDLAKTPSHVNVVILSFAKPECTYTKGSYVLSGTGLDFSSDGTVVRDAVKILKSNNPGTRVLLAVGGATYTNFAALNMTCIKDLVDDLGLDGADIDYEPSNPACQRLSGGGVKCATDAESVDVVTKFRAAMPKGQYLLTTASWHVGCYGVGAFVNSQPTFSQYFGVNLAMAKSAAGASLDAIHIMSYDAGGPSSPSSSPTGFSWRESFLSQRAAWPNAAVALGVEVPPEAWGGYVSDAADVQARADYVLANGGAGLMLWSLQKPGTPNPKTVASLACTKFGTCSTAPWPFPGSAR